jgi:hypothetical protein
MLEPELEPEEHLRLLLLMTFYKIYRDYLLPLN